MSASRRQQTAPITATPDGGFALSGLQSARTVGRIRRFSRRHPAFHVFCSRFASQHVIQDADKVHRGEGRAIEPNGGHPVKAPGADKRHGLPQRRCHQRVHIGVIPVIEADHIRFFIHRQPIDANRRTAPKVGFTLPALTMPYSSSTSRNRQFGPSTSICRGSISVVISNGRPRGG